jgi:hypothetical protein
MLSEGIAQISLIHIRFTIHDSRESNLWYSDPDAIIIPSAVLFVAHDTSTDLSQFSCCGEDSCPELGRWGRLSQSSTAVDFRRIVRDGWIGYPR